MNVIPQLFEIWRKSVLLTVGAISLGAEQLETSVMGLMKSERTERAPRVKVPVRAGKVETGTARSRAAATTRKARVTRKPAAKPAKLAAKTRKVRVHAGHVPEATMATPSTTPVESLVSEASAN